MSVLIILAPGWWVGQDLERKDGPILNESQWGLLLQRTGFSGLDGSISDTENGRATGSVMISTAISGESNSTPQVTLVMEEGTKEPLSSALTASFEGSMQRKPTVATLETLDPQTSPYCIVLPSAQGVWRQLSKPQFKSLQNLTLQSKGILWVTRGAWTSDPDANMALGVMRSLRSEDAGLCLVTLDLDDQEQLNDNEAAAVISRVYNYVFDSADFCSRDSEFYERKGVIHIPRALPDTAKNDFLGTEINGAVPEPQPFYQESRPLKLRLGTPGLLDSLHFVDDEPLLRAIGDDDVEIDIQAAGVSLRTHLVMEDLR